MANIVNVRMHLIIWRLEILVYLCNFFFAKTFFLANI